MSLEISKEKQELNYLFYLFLKEIYGGNGLNDNEIELFLETYINNKNANLETIKDIFDSKIDSIKKEEKQINLKVIFLEIKTVDILNLFILSLKLIKIKNILLEEAKLSSSSIITNKQIHPLSIEKDSLGKKAPYLSRVNGALLSLLFFQKLESGETNFISKITENYLKELSNEVINAKKIGIEPNQIFMLMFSESINQSIRSTAGSSYEERVEEVLISIGIKKETISKIHANNDKASEYDFFFSLNGKNYGISAKRTLRERYKQSIKTQPNIDISIEITLGLDLNENKATTIKNYGTFIFVADEIYNSRKYLQDNSYVYPCSKLTRETLLSLKNKNLSY